MGKKFSGKTEDAEAPFLGAEFWKPGREVVGHVERVFESKNGPCAVLTLKAPVELAGVSCEEVSIGNLAGFRMALQAAGLSALEKGDFVTVRCTSTRAAQKEGHSPRVNFEVEVVRQ